MRLKLPSIFLLFFLIAFKNLSASQNKIDSLQILLKTTKGNEQIDILNNLSIAYRYTSLNSSLDYANQAIKLAQKNNYLVGEGDGYKNRGIVFYYQNKYSEALAEYIKANELYKKDKNQNKISAMLNNIAIIKVQQGEYSQALEDYEEAAKINLKLGNITSVANIYNNIGMVYSKLGNAVKSLEYYTKSLDISIEENNKIGIAAAYNNIALIQKSFGKFDVAIEYYQKAIKVNEELGDKSGTARCLRNMASVYIQIGEDDKALSLLEEGLEIDKELNNEQGVLISYSKIGQIQLKLGKYNDAIKSYEKSIEVAQAKEDKEQIIDSYKSLGTVYKNIENYKKALYYYKLSLDLAKDIEQLRSTAHLYYSIGDCYTKMNELTEALKYFTLCAELAETNGYITLLEDVYRSLSRIYKKDGDFEKAFDFLTKYIEAHENIYTSESQERVAELQTKFETEKKEKEILQLKAQQQETKQKSQLVFIVSAFIVLLIIIILLYNRFLIKKKSIRLLDQKNLLLGKANEELILAKEKAEESDRLKTAFLANISHEIRTPLNAIIGFSDFLNDPDLSDKEKEELNLLVNLNSDLLLKIIDDILDISLIEAGQLKIKKEKVNLNNLIEETYQLLKDDKNLKESNVGFSYYNNSQNGNIELYSDPFRLKQILINLVSNSIKFTNKGEVSFGYNVVSINNQKMVEFKVADTGIGIEKKYHGLIFNMFYKVTDDRSSLYRGTGVGLSITKSLVKQMGGDIWLQSELGKGSVFYFNIPVESN